MPKAPRRPPRDAQGAKISSRGPPGDIEVANVRFVRVKPGQLGLGVALTCYRLCVRRQPRPLPTPLAVQAKLELPSTGAPHRSRRVGESRVDAVEAHDTHATRRRLKWSEGLKLVDVAFGVT